MILRPALLVLVAALALAGCGGGRGILSNRDAPDELLAGRQAPLVIPPDYNLAPPKPGAPRPLAPDARQEAVQALFPTAPPEPPKSASETALLEAAGAARAADPTARSTVGSPDTTIVNKGAFTRIVVLAPAGGDRNVAQVTTGAGG